MKFTMIRRITALGLILVLAAGIPIQASSASTEKVTEDAASTKSLQEAQDEKAQLEKALKEAQGTIEDLKDSKGDIESKVTELNQQLMDISARITDLENQLTAKSEDIQETKDELAGAKEREAQQYADMKVRIQFMYENGQTSYLEALLSSRNISEFLNSADYIAQIQSYDRQKLTEYQDTVESIVNLEAQLEQEYTDLEALKSTVESNKATVAAMMRQKESELADISGDIEDAQSDADYYAAEIQAQEELIAAIKRAEAEKAAAGVEEHPYTGGAVHEPQSAEDRQDQVFLHLLDLAEGCDGFADCVIAHDGDAVVGAAYAVVEVLFAAQIGAPVGEKFRILPLYPFPNRLLLRFRIVQGDFCPYLFFAGLGIQHMAFAVK